MMNMPLYVKMDNAYAERLKEKKGLSILLIHTADYLHHQQPSRQHAIFEILADRHDVYVLHFHVSRGTERSTNLHVVEATRYDRKSVV